MLKIIEVVQNDFSNMENVTGPFKAFELHDEPVWILDEEGSVFPGLVRQKNVLGDERQVGGLDVSVNGAPCSIVNDGSEMKGGQHGIPKLIGFVRKIEIPGDRERDLVAE